MAADGSIVIDTTINNQGVNQELRALQREMKNLHNEMKLANMQAMMPFQRQLVRTEMDMFRLGQSMGNYSGTTKDFMNNVQQLGAEYKQASDNMINADRMIAQSMIQTAGQMMNMSTQASKISATYERMGNPMYQVNRAGLAIADSLNQMANRGDAAVLALEMLGPNASMKQLYDLQTQITQGQMRLQQVFIATGLTALVTYGTLHSLAMDTNDAYAKSFNNMKETLLKAIEPMITAFSMVMTKVYDFATAVGELIIKFNEAHPTLALMIQGTMMLVPALMLLLSPLSIGIGLINGFRSALNAVWMLIGPAVTGMAAMSATVWLVAAAIVALTAGIVYLWNNHEGFKNAVLTAWEAIKNAVSVAWQFIVQAVQVGIDFVKSVIQTGLELVKSFWSEHGTAIIGVVMAYLDLAKEYYSTIFEAVKTVVSDALNAIVSFWDAHGASIMAAVKAAYDFIKDFLSSALQAALQVVTTVLTSIKEFWDKHGESIKNAVKTAYEEVKSLIKAALEIVKTFVKQVLDDLKKWWDEHGKGIYESIKAAYETVKAAITAALKAVADYVKEKLSEIKKWWDENGKGIEEAAKKAWNWIKEHILSTLKAILDNVRSQLNFVLQVVTTGFNALKPVVQAVWDALVLIIKTAWTLIKGVIDVGLNTIKGIIVAVSAAINGDWSKAWQTIKQTVKQNMDTVVQTLKNINLLQVGKDIMAGLYNGIVSGAKAVLDKAGEIADSIKDKISSALKIHSPSRVMMQMGEWTTEGLAIGMTNKTKDVLRASQGMANASMAGFNGQSVSNVNNSKTYQPKIVNNFTTKALSPSEVQRAQTQSQRRLAMEWMGGFN